MGDSQDVAQRLTSYLTTKSIRPSEQWLQTFVATVKSNTPWAAIQKSAEFRILASDITTSLQQNASQSLPANATNAAVQEIRLPGAIVVQVLDIEDIGRSRWSQVERLEQQERGEMTRGREIIRLAPVADEEQPQTTSVRATQDEASKGPHKLLLQDTRGTKISAFELLPIRGISLSMSIGTKILLKGAVVARGVVLLEPQTAELLGGKIDALDAAWRKNRKETLKARIVPVES